MNCETTTTAATTATTATTKIKTATTKGAKNGLFQETKPLSFHNFTILESQISKSVDR